MKVAMPPSLKPTPWPKTWPRLKNAPLSKPEPMAVITPIGEMANSLSRPSLGDSDGCGSSTGVRVSGSSANENRMDTSAKGTKPKRSPTRISQLPMASETPLTAIYAAKTLPRWWLCATTLSQLSTTM